jgi:putative phosphoserine phosphatase/1-acylglycerol-3-phosphate O-acyltransferase
MTTPNTRAKGRSRIARHDAAPLVEPTPETPSDDALEAELKRIARSPRGPQIGAFFDYDGTLIDGYSAGAYFTDRLRRGEMGAREVLDTVKMVRKGDLSDAEFGEVIGKGILDWSGRTEDEMRALWRRLFVSKTGATLFPEAWKLVRAHQRKGHTVAIASSATRYQIEPLAEEYGVAHIVCTEAMVRNGRLTGGIVGQPMWGEGKAAGVRAFAAAHGIDLRASFGYANGNEDIAFLKTVGHARAVQPKEQLAGVATDRGWPILRLAPRKRGPAEAMARTAGAYGAMAASFLAGLAFAKATGRNRRAVDFITSAASDAALAVLGVDVEVVDEHHLWSHRPCVFIINHQSKFDMFLMMYLIRRGFTGVAKKEAANTPGFGTFMKMADMAFIDRAHTGKAIDALRPAVERLKQGLCVAIAPEGTRSWTPKVGKFKKGAFHMAQQAGVPVVPVVIRNAGEIMGRNDQTMRAGTVQVAVLPPVQVTDWAPEEMDARVAEVRQMFVDTLEHWPEKGR